MTPGRVIFLMGLLTALMLAMVYQGALLRQAGYRLQRVEAQIAEAEADRVRCMAQLSKLSSPQRILALVERLRLDLHLPPVSAAEPPASSAAQVPSPPGEPLEDRISTSLASVHGSTQPAGQTDEQLQRSVVP